MGGLAGPDGASVLAHGHNGAFHLWTLESDDVGDDVVDDVMGSTSAASWRPRVLTGGHFGPVVDAAFDPSGAYLVTVSADQTTRVWGPCVTAASAASPTRWREIGRAQVHGYDLTCVAFAGHHEFVTGADEKVLRVFGVPASSLASFGHVLGRAMVAPPRPVPADSAHTPALGLSNKAAVHGGGGKRAGGGGGGGEEEDGDGNDEDAPLPVQSVVLVEPPLEEALMEGTLWAEVEKLCAAAVVIRCLLLFDCLIVCLFVCCW